ncbi:flagellar motor stator protein MotA [Neobacillus sp. MM2021_6]|uniref:flagellar motor stator protein MotA n=1 Tax=Bacillaceae TaxID=186817 RepID=UPI00140D3D54|nr:MULTISPECIES: flagellar motor stator protein MotA [Bacillaceae]MBO0961810.1 flagellar motor stator protein MotA [Neobacillus sp. MM2021_6]NHC20231.1 flagellar motor stator protein MotA [Bacillus sp. MM2020_4]WML39344.1 flagellar motor stator protein MotA [Neobacillus sp. OS1-2]
MSSIFGILLALVAIGVGMVLKGASLSALNNPAALLIIFGGTIAAVMIAFPFSELKKVGSLFKIAFFEPKQPSKAEQISTFVECAGIAKREGILALEETAANTKDPFFKKGLELIIDGYDTEFIEEVLFDELGAIEKRHKTGALIFTQAGTYAPTLGVLGAVVGLIASLGNLNDVEKLGHSISAAFIATLLGIFTGYVLWHPLANKLKRISKQEQDLKMLILEGLLAISRGLSPSAIEKKLSAHLAPKDRKKLGNSAEEKSYEKSA